MPTVSFLEWVPAAPNIELVVARGSARGAGYTIHEIIRRMGELHYKLKLQEEQRNKPAKPCQIAGGIAEMMGDD